MKTKLLLALIALAPLAQADTLPEGSFKGNGLWKSEIANGDYSVISEIKGKTISNDYKFKDGTQFQWQMEMQSKENGFFDVISKEKTVGSGYCLDHVALCHYELSTDDLKLEETLTLQNEKLYKFGSKIEKGRKVMWQESLSK